MNLQRMASGRREGALETLVHAPGRLENPRCLPPGGVVVVVVVVGGVRVLVEAGGVSASSQGR